MPKTVCTCCLEHNEVLETWLAGQCPIHMNIHLIWWYSVGTWLSVGGFSSYEPITCFPSYPITSNYIQMKSPKKTMVDLRSEPTARWNVVIWIWDFGWVSWDLTSHSDPFTNKRKSELRSPRIFSTTPGSLDRGCSSTTPAATMCPVIHSTIVSWQWQATLLQKIME